MSRTADATVLPAMRRVPEGRVGRTRDALLVGAAAALLSVLFSWVPSLWYDEAATVVSATRSWPELAREVGTVDLVHAAYYSLLHLWFDLVGYSPFTLRLPSAVAIGIAAGGLVALLRAVVPRRTAVLAGVVFAVLPRTVWAGGEGRSYAISIALALGLLAAYVFAARASSGGRRQAVLGWLAYAAVAVLACSVFLYLALVVAAAGATALWTALRKRRRRELIGWAAAAAGSAALLAPLAHRIAAQSGQVWWIPPLGARTPADVFVAQSFGGADLLALLVWVLALAGVAATLLGGRGREPRQSDLGQSGLRGPGAGVPSLIELLVPFVVVPILGLLAASVMLSPLYSPRYLGFTTLGLAAFAAVGIAALPARALSVAALVGVLALSVPPAVAQRLPESKQHSSWAEAASLLARERASEPAGTREAVVFGALRRHPSATTRVLEYAYPDAFAGLEDPALLVPARESGQLWEERAPLEDVLGRFADDDTVWLFVSDEGAGAEEATRELGTVGLRPDGAWHLSYLDVVRFRR